MKKLLLLAFLLCAVLQAKAIEWTDGNGVTWSFTATQTTATITGFEPKSTTVLVIPSKVYIGAIEYTVTSFSNSAFSNCTSLTSVTIPESVTSIGESAFYGCTGLSSMTIPESVTSIGESAFYGCTGLTSMTIPESVTSIGESAFYGCTGLTSMTIPKSVTSISKSAFYDCTSLTSVTIPEGVTSIGKSAFYGCTSLTSVSIPESVTSIGTDAFAGCTGLTSVKVMVDDMATFSNNQVVGQIKASINKPVILVDSEGNEITEYAIPEGVKSIGVNAFNSCTGLTSVTIPQSVTSIGFSAFSGCSGLKSVTIPEGVTSIGSNTFSGCSSLTSVTIPSSVTSIGSSAFLGCSGLTSVTIPESVTSIGSYTFYGCSGLTSVTIPEGVTSIGSYTFYGCTGLTSVTIPEGVTSIGTSAFYNCSGLTSVIIPSSVTSIGSSAFLGCSGLTSVTINSNSIMSKAYSESSSLKNVFGSQVKEYIIGESVTSIGADAFYGCSDLTSVTIPESVTSIGADAFYGCSALTSVTISEGVTSIGEGAFQGCYGLTSVTIPSSVTSISQDAFRGCSGLKSVTISDGVTSIGSAAFRSCSGLTSVTIPEGVTSIGSYAFYYCSALTSVTIPSSVEKIGDYAFAENKSLNSVYCFISSPLSIKESTFYRVYNIATLYVLKESAYLYAQAQPWNQFNIDAIPDGMYDSFWISTIEKGYATITGCTSPEGDLIIPQQILWAGTMYNVTSIGDKAFQGCSGLTSVTIPSSVTSIGSSAFQGCYGLTSVTIPSSVTSIGSSAFFGCSGLTSVTIPSSVTSISQDVFRGCSGLTSVTISDGVASIGSNTFSGCSGLKSVTIPESVTSIGDYVFQYCSGLTSMTIPSSLKSIGEYAFKGCTALASVIISEGLDYFGRGTFSDCSGLTSVIIPSSVTSIGSYAFEGCTGLTSVTIPSSVTSIGDNAFYKCSSLTSVTIPESVKRIGESAFSCSGLTSVSIPDGMRDIGKYAFSYCSGLTSVTIGKDVTIFDTSVFLNCSHLTNVTINSNAIMPTPEDYSYLFFHFEEYFGKQVNEYILGEEVTSISEGAFNSCTNMTSLTISQRVKHIGYNSSTNLTTVKVIVTDKAAFCKNQVVGQIHDKIQKPVTLIDSEGKEMTEYAIPEGVKTIGANAFYNCSGLTSVTIPEGVTNIGEYAFSRCTGLTNITIPKGTIIHYNAFGRCSSLTSVTLLGVEFTGTFYDEKFGFLTDRSFEDCNSLTTVYNYSDVPTSSITSETFSNRANATLYVPYEAIKKYVDAEYWKEFKEIKPIPDSYDIWQFHISDSTAIILGTSQQSDSLIIPSVVYKDGQGYPVTSIYAGAFKGQSSLTNLTIPSSVTSIGDYAFSKFTNLTSVKVIVTDMATFCNNKVMAWIKSYFNKPVTLIDSEGNEITEYVIPEGVTSIGYDAFSNCTGLTSVTIPESVMSIGSGAFSNCTGLTSVTIPESVTSIGESAFNGCSGLTSVTISSSVTHIGESTFAGCTNLATVKVMVTDMATFCNNKVIGQIKARINKPVTLIDSEGNEITVYVIPGGVESIGANAFYNCTGLASVTFPEGVTTIGSEAFYGCSGLTSVTIPEGVTTIYGFAFAGCTNLTSVKVIVTDMATFCNNKVISQIKVRINKPVTLVDSEGNEITEYVIPEGVKSIGANAFYNCTGLVGLTIPEGVTSIGEGAFLGCTGLTSVTINSNSIMSKAYSEASSLKNVFRSQVKEYIIGESVTSIGADAFYGCSDLTSVTIPSSVTSIGADAFSGCTGLTKVIAPNIAAWCSIAFESSGSNPLSYAKHFYSDEKTEITNLVIPSIVTSIGRYAFRGCSGLTSVTIPEGVTSIGRSAFEGCSGLTSATIPEGVTTIGSSAFESCTGLAGLTIPEGVKTIGSSAFESCTGLTSVTIPSSVTSIGTDAFNGCSSLATVYCYVKTPLSISSSTFSNRANATLYVPYESKIAYLIANYWKEFKEIKTISDSDGIWQFAIYNSTASIRGTTQPSDNMTIPSVVSKDGQEYPVTSIEAGAFSGQSSLTSVTIPQSVTSISADAFAGCTNLAMVKVIVTDMATFCNNQVVGQIKASINKPVTLIDSEGKEITDYVIPESVKSIGANAFNNCSGLTSVTIPESVTSIGADAFASCTNLASVKVIVNDKAAFCNNQVAGQIKASINKPVTLIDSEGKEMTVYVIPEGVKSIGVNAFNNCTGLTSVTILESVTSIGTDAFNGCTSLTTVYCYVKTPLPISSGTFSNRTNATLYVPYDSKDAYFAANYWKEFKEIKTISESDGIWQFSISKSTALITGTTQQSDNLTIPAIVSKDGQEYPVTSIEAGAFSGQSNLTSVTFPQSVTSISTDAFAGCTNLTSVKVIVTDKAAFCNNQVVGQIKASINKPVILVDSEGNEITEYVIPEGVKTIGANAFYNCTGLAGVIIPQSVTNISTDAFAGCTNLATVKVMVTDMATFSNNQVVRQIKSSINKPVTLVDSEGNEMTVYVIPEGVKSIGVNAFNNCIGLTSVTIPESVTSIGTDAFNGCTSLTTVYCYVKTPLPISSGTFSNRTNATLYVPYDSKDAYLAANYWKEFKEIKTIVESDGIWQFSISNSTALITGTTQQSDNLTIPAIVSKDGQEYPVTSIEAGAFFGQSNLTSVTFPQSVTSISTDAFAGCTNLTSVKVIVTDKATFCNNQVVGQIKASINKPVTLVDSEGNEITDYVIPEGVKSIGANAFYNCTGLTSVTIPSSVTSIGDIAFSCCTGLTSVTIPEGVTSIGYLAFSDCTGLTSVTIPKSVTSIGDNAFDECPALTEVYCYIPTPLKINSGTFSNRFNATLYVPVGSKNAYQTAIYWKDFKSIKEMGAVEPTGIEDAGYEATPGKTIKVFKNGRVKILKDGKVYDLNGTREK